MINTLMLGMALLGQSTERKFDYAVWMNGTKSGQAQITVKDLPEGKRQVLLTMTLKVASTEARIRQESIYDADGAASRKIMESTVNGGQRTLLVAELNDKGAELTTTANGKTSKETIPLSAKAPRTNPSIFWFDRTQPKPGAKISYYSFEMNEKQWRLVTSNYLGPKSYALGGKSITAHRVIISRAGAEVENWMDAKGMPIALIQGDAMKIERIP